MRHRIITIVVAILCGLAAAALAASYVNKAKNEALAKAETVKVLTAVTEVPVGLTIKELEQRALVEYRKVPKEFVAEGALTKGRNRLKKEVLAVGLNPGEQLTADKFKSSADAGLAFTIPDDMVAVAIPIDDMKAAGNLIKVGDYVNVVGTTKNSDDKEMTKTILQKVKVLAVGGKLRNPEETKPGPASQSGNKEQAEGRTATLALSQSDTEKLIFMQDQGRIWLTLLPSKKAKLVTTGGQTVDSVFK